MILINSCYRLKFLCQIASIRIRLDGIIFSEDVFSKTINSFVISGRIAKAITFSLHFQIILSSGLSLNNTRTPDSQENITGPGIEPRTSRLLVDRTNH